MLTNFLNVWLLARVMQSGVAATLAVLGAAFGLRLAWRLLAGFTIPGAAVAGVLGVHLVQARGIGWKEGWVHASMGLWALALLLSVLVLAPRVRRTLRAAEASLEAGLPSEELKSLLAARWPGYVADFNALAVVLLTLLMVLQPF